MSRWSLLLLLAPACRAEPPGASVEPGTSAPVVEVQAVGESGEAPEGGAHDVVPGTIEDAQPFDATATKVASIAWRTWVYSDVGPARTRYGYLRAGAIVDARGPAIQNDGCQGGWYRVNPRGFVCVGKGATLDLEDPILAETAVRPVRKQGLPYLYALAGEVPPFRYFKLASKDEQRTIEGDGILQQTLRWRETLAVRGVKQLLGEPGEPPGFLQGGKPLQKAYGMHQDLHYAVHAGRAAPDSGFAISHVFDWEGRTFGLSTELDLIALDRTHLVKPSAFHGVELGPGETLPVAFVAGGFLQRYVVGDSGAPTPSGSWQKREGIKLTGKTFAGSSAFLETRDGALMPAAGARIVQPRDSFPSFATGDRRWIDLSIRDQTLVAYEGQKPVYVTLVSTGRGGLGDPEKVFATVRGTFMIVSKHVSATMDGEDDKSDSYNLLDVPFVQYFHKGYALHGTYWHDEFGQVRSHGCVNLSPIDSAWLFEWTDPNVPADWHGAVNKDRGTVVHVHP